jgi:hypothetical protein
MTSINPINDAELRRLNKNRTDSQKKKNEVTKEGVVVNYLIKEPKTVDMHDLYDSLVISDNAQMPMQLNENKNIKEKNLLPISLVSTGVMAALALVSFLVKKSSQAHLTLKTTQKLPSLTRNLAINEEMHQAIYQMVQCPNQKTVFAGIGVITISTMAFMGKMFMDGFKEVWVKKREADIQKNLQEKLIAVETQSFGGKIQIVRSLLSEKANEFSEYLCNETETPLVFKSFNNRLKFMGRIDQTKETSQNFNYFALGAITLLGIVGLGFLSLKNLRAGKQHLEKYIRESKAKISEIISQSNSKTKEIDKTNLKNMLQAIDAEPNYIKDELLKLPWDDSEKKKFIEEISFNTQKSTATINRTLGGDGTPKPAFYSHVNDYRAFLYNWLLDTSNPLFKNLFIGITGVSAISYGGKVLGEAVKEVQVKKMNAQTELELQQRLVATELRNFKAKKDAAINPLCDEFYVQLQKGKSKQELKTIAENILFEVKNGPPFVYS